MKNLIKKPIFYIPATIAVLIGGYLVFGGNKSSVYETTIVKRGTVVQEVSVTGRVKSSQGVELAFEKSGRVSRVNTVVGNEVKAGQSLIELENSDLVAQLAGVEATLKSQQARLDELKRGTRPEEINIQEVKVVNAETALGDSKKDLVNKIQDAFIKADDAVRNQVDQLYSNPRGLSPAVKFTVSDSQLKTDLEWQRLLIENSLNLWDSSLDSLTINSNLDTYTKTAKTNLDQIKNFLDKIASAVNSFIPDTVYTQTTVDGWRTSISTARTSVSTATINLSTADEGLQSAESALSLAENELVLSRAGTAMEQITAQEANVEKAEADVDSYRSQIAKTILRSPIDGIITKVDIKKGEIVSANTVVVSIISKSNFEIEANIPEVDIAKVKIGDFASVTLDAYGNNVIFEVRVIKIDPAETMIEGVATYKTTFQFTSGDDRVKSGMTANIDIATAKAENVIIIPQRLVVSINGDKIIKVLEGNRAVERKIKTGIRGVDGNIEVTEGLKEGEKLITSL